MTLIAFEKPQSYIALNLVYRAFISLRSEICGENLAMCTSKNCVLIAICEKFMSLLTLQ